MGTRCQVSVLHTRHCLKLTARCSTSLGCQVQAFPAELNATHAPELAQPTDKACISQHEPHGKVLVTEPASEGAYACQLPQLFISHPEHQLPGAQPRPGRPKAAGRKSKGRRRHTRLDPALQNKAAQPSRMRPRNTGLQCRHASCAGHLQRCWQLPSATRAGAAGRRAQLDAAPAQAHSVMMCRCLSC